MKDTNIKDMTPQELRDMNQGEFDEKVNELRKERNEYSDKAGAVQREIDRLYMERQDFAKFEGKFVKWLSEDDANEYILVKSVKRRHYGACLSGPSIKFYTDMNDVIFFEDGDLEIGHASDVEIVDQKELVDKLSPMFAKIVEIFNGEE